MRIQELNREEPEKIFMTIKNVKGSTVSAGEVVVYDISTDADGKRVDQPATASLKAVAGVAIEDIADDDFGSIQIYGYHGTAAVKRTDTTQAAGLALLPADGVDYLVSGAAGDFVLLESLSTATATTSAKVHIRCL